MKSYLGDVDIWKLTRDEHIRMMVTVEDMGYKIKSNNEMGHGKHLEQTNNTVSEDEEEKWVNMDSELSDVSEDWDSMEEEDNQDWEKEMEKLSKVE